MTAAAKKQYQQLDHNAIDDLHIRYQAQLEAKLDRALQDVELPPVLQGDLRAMVKLRDLSFGFMRRMDRLRIDTYNDDRLTELLREATAPGTDPATVFDAADEVATRHADRRASGQSIYDAAEVPKKHMEKFARAARACRYDRHVEAAFAGRDRIYLSAPAQGGELQEYIARLLSYMPPLREGDADGYTITDWAKGLAVDATGKQTVKIGRLLKKHAAYALAEFEKRDTGNLMIMISRNVDDIARASTNRGWSSCMGPRYDGPAYRKLQGGLRKGQMVAYLIRPTDVNADDPLARVMINPYVRVLPYDDAPITEMIKDIALMGRGAQRVVWGPSKVYGQSNQSFSATVAQFLDDKINVAADGVYDLSSKVYPEGSTRKRLGKAGPAAGGF